VVCLDVVKDGEERQQLHEKLVDSGRCVVVVSIGQMMAMAANCLEVMGDDGRRRLVISTRAWNSLEEEQRKELTENTGIVQCRVDKIEEVGGGGIRQGCLLISGVWTLDNVPYTMV